MERSAIHQTLFQARNDGFLEVPYNKNVEPSPRSQSWRAYVILPSTAQLQKAEPPPSFFFEAFAYRAGCLG